MRIRARAVLATIGVFWCGCALFVGLDDDRHLVIEAGAPDAALDGADAAEVPGDATDGPADAPIDAQDGGREPALLAMGHHPTFLRADATSVFWIEEATGGAPGAVMKIDIDGGEPVVLAGNLQKPAGLRISTNDVYFTNDWVPPDGGNYGLFSVPKSSDGGAPMTLVDKDGQGYGALSIVLQDNDLLSEAWSDQGPTRIRRTTLGQKTCYLGSAPGRIPAISSNSSPVYYVDEQAGNIMMTGLQCDSGAALFAKANATARGFVHVGDYIYWLTSTGIYKLDKNDAGDAPTPLQFGNINPAQIYSSGVGLYFTNPADGTVRNELATIASGQGGPFGLDFGGANTLFWTNHDSGEIMMLAPQ